MSDRCFLDSNVILYALDASDESRANVARRLVAARPVVSTQVLGETASVMLRKLGIPPDQVGEHLRLLQRRCFVTITALTDYFRAVELHKRYQFSFWDCLVIAAALSAECEILYTEDLQDDQVLEGRLRVLNPFASHGPLS